MLTARALATFLASQDHPKKYLCPHLTADGAKPPKPVTSPQLCTCDRSTERSELEPALPKSSIKRPEIEEGLDEPLHRHTTDESHVRKKDEKSFAQSLFDTNAMRMLHSAKTSDVTCQKIDLGDSLTQSPVCVVRDCGVAPKTQHEVKDFLDETNMEHCLSAHCPESPDVWVDKGFTQMVDVPDKGPVSESPPESFSFQKGSKKLARDAVEEYMDLEQELPDDVIEAIEAIEADHEIINQTQHQAWKEMHSRTFTHMVEDTPYDADIVKLVLGGSYHTLPYLSLRNVLSLCCSASYIQDARDARKLLRQFNRSSSYLTASKDSPFGTGANPQMIHFLHRSVSYVCGTPHALLRSFVEWKETNSACKIARSYPLNSIAMIFRLMDTLVDSATMLSSLQRSVDYIFPNDRHRAKSNHLYSCASHKDSTTAGLNKALSSAEAAHIAKIALAALVARFRSASRTDIYWFQQTRGKGQEVPPDWSPYLYDCNVSILDRFENAAAVSLVVRLAETMASRQWMRESTCTKCSQPADQLEQNSSIPSFMTLVVHNLADPQGLQVKIHTDTSPPSLQYGVVEPDAIQPIVYGQDQTPANIHLIIEWMRTVILKKWDGKPYVFKCSAIGGALEFLKAICKPMDQKLPMQNALLTVEKTYITHPLLLLKASSILLTCTRLWIFWSSQFNGQIQIQTRRKSTCCLILSFSLLHYWCPTFGPSITTP